MLGFLVREMHKAEITLDMSAIESFQPLLKTSSQLSRKTLPTILLTKQEKPLTLI